MLKRERTAILCALKTTMLLVAFFEEATPRETALRRRFEKRLDALQLVEDCLREALGIGPDVTRDEVHAMDVQAGVAPTSAPEAHR
jgi:hypothetical protein